MKKLIAAMALVLVCSAAYAGGSVMMYSSMQEDQLIAVKKGFEAKYPDTKMEYYFAGTGKVMTKITTEAQAGHVDADILWVGDPTNYVAFKELGILEKYSSPEAAAIDPAFIDADGFYTGARMMNMGIAYGASVDPADAPKTWNDLLDPKWNDQVVMSDPNTAGTTKYWRNAMMANPKYGVPFMEKLKANKCYFESGTTATHNQVAAGAYKVGVCLDYVTANLVKEGSPITFVYPEDTVSITSPIGIVKGAKNIDNAKLLYDFILSKEGQEILVANNLLSVRSDVAQNADTAAIAAKAMPSDMAEVVKSSKANAEAFDKIFR